MALPSEPCAGRTWRRSLASATMKDRVLECAAKLTKAEFLAPSGVTTRNLRATLVHTLDVESSWRARLQGKPEEVWKKELAVTDYPRVATLIDHWRRDEREML